jgi:hypothetical protein
MTHPNVSLEELADILRIQLTQVHAAKLSQAMQLNAFLDGRFSDIDMSVLSRPGAVVLLAELIARRLYADNPTTEFLTVSEVKAILQASLTAWDWEHFEPDPVVREVTAFLQEVQIKILVNLLTTSASPEISIYEDYWEWVNAVITVAAERSISPSDALTDQSAMTEITRRSLKQEDFIRIAQERQRKFADAEAFMAEMMQPLLRILHPDDKEYQEAEAEFRANILPEFMDIMTSSAVFFEQQLAGEISRIYG